MQKVLKNSFEHIKMNKKRLLAFMICCLMFAVGQFLMQPSQAAAASKITSEEQMEQLFGKSIKKGNKVITFTSSQSYTAAQIQKVFESAAKKQGRLLSGSMQLSISSDGADRNMDYKIDLSDDALMKVKVLKSKKAAVKAAAKALKEAEYSTNYYSDNSYYDVFRRLLQQHPEYNYDTSVWKNSNGAYGYQRSSSLTKKQQKDRMEEADRAASAAVKKCVKSGMTDKQKAKAVHNYIVKNCRYARYQNAFTAYGALVEGTAVCQGYAAAFNLMALKCGLQSMTVCGTTTGGAHAWTYVKIGNKYRYIDCTWDDTDERGNGFVQVYFNVTAEKMKEEHMWDEAEFPASDIKYYKYFK